jgi:D-glycero-D-manno-heptose 1,7-bisphosphate phosphatase
MSLHKCVFLDRDGVLNEELGDYLWQLENLVIPEGVPEALKMLKQAGYLLIVITNQAGIAQGLYKSADVLAIHGKMQEVSGNLLDDIYFAPDHPRYTSESLSRKPGTLMIEKAIAKYHISPQLSWMVGDRERDMEAGKNSGLKTVHIVSSNETSAGDFAASDLLGAAKIILKF